jgi:PIN domain nuclease of toxin-antitoxin system
VLLLDTHVVIWISLHPDRLSQRAVQAIEASHNQAESLFISDTALFEIANLVTRKRVALQASLEVFLQEVESHFVVLPIDRRIAARAAELPGNYPKDPVDRLIGATALVAGLSLVTADSGIQKSKVVETIW